MWSVMSAITDLFISKKYSMSKKRSTEILSQYNIKDKSY